jgi:ubiquinone/menaquinone biosynthesis C-methylase UbiE
MPQDWDEPTISASLLASQNPTHARVLDIGCGEGKRTIGYLEKAGSVIGIDPNRELLLENLALRTIASGNLRALVQARAERLPFPCDAFDVALLSWSL